MQSDLIEIVDRIAQDRCNKAVRDAAETGTWPAGVWGAFEEVGLTAATIPEAAGGPGLDFEDAMAALRRSAYHALPLPLAETMLAARLLSAAGLPIPDGALTVAPANACNKVHIARDGEGFCITGVVHRVPWGNDCGAVVIAGDIDGKSMVTIASTAGCVTEMEHNLAGEPRAVLRFDNTPLNAAISFDRALEKLMLEGALIRSVQIAGALQRALEYSLQYAGERVAFGRPIAKFQAVQQMLAVLAGQVAAASAAADMAVEGSSLAQNEVAIAIAKARAGEAAGRGAEIAHQVHGAMGFTHEHSLHYVTRRLWSWREEFGNETHWQTRLGRLTAASGAEALWPMLTAISEK